jgi:hypothetical protein
MSTQEEKKVEAYSNIDICCETLCNKEKVINYIKFLEYENELLKGMIKHAINSETVSKMIQFT